jgi:glycosyltransferase involved in cell wall biosynthesis
LNSRREFEELDRNQSFDLFHFHTTLPSAGILLSKRSHTIPKVCTFYGPWCDEFRIESKARVDRYALCTKILYNVYTRQMYLPMKVLQQVVLKKSSTVIVLSKYSKQTIAELWGASFVGKIRLIPGGVDTEKFLPPTNKNVIRNKLGLNQNVFVLLTVRRLVPRMGLEVLIESMSIACTKEKDIQLIIIGEGILEHKLKRMVEELHLDGKVIFKGYIDDDILPLYYQAADLFVLPTKALEGFGLILLESLASGTPVLATSVGAIPEILSKFDAKFLLPDTEPQTMARAILRLTDFLQNNPDLGSKCREFVLQNYSWDRIVGKIEDLYAETLEGG